MSAPRMSPCLQLLLSARLDVCITQKKQQGYLFSPLVTQTAGWKGTSQRARNGGTLEAGKKKNHHPTFTLSNLSCKGSQIISCLIEIRREASLLLSHGAHLAFSKRHFATTDLFKAHGLVKLVKAKLCLMEQHCGHAVANHLLAEILRGVGAGGNKC